MYKFIGFNDNKKSVINILDVTSFFSEKVNGSNAYFNINFLLKNGKDLTIRYELDDEENYIKDIEYLNSLTSRR